MTDGIGFVGGLRAAGFDPAGRRALLVGAGGAGSAIALALLTPWFIWLAVSLVGADALTVRATLAQPLNAVLMLAFVISLFWHARLGLQVVIEDYQHNESRVVFLVLLNLYVLAVYATAVFSILKVAFGAAS